MSCSLFPAKNQRCYPVPQFPGMPTFPRQLLQVFDINLCSSPKRQWMTLPQLLTLWYLCSFAVVEAECERSSATTYFWYREALDISNSISESGGLNWKMTLCLLVAWSLVGLAMIKGIQSSGKVGICSPSSRPGFSYDMKAETSRSTLSCPALGCLCSLG